MSASRKNWTTLHCSPFPWEQDALDFIHQGFPPGPLYHAWANFEFVADDGSINEVDLLVACPNGIFLIEIKSRPGVVTGDAQLWTWDHDGNRKTVENPLLLINRKAKRLKSVLTRQNALKKLVGPYFDSLVFLSNVDLKFQITGLGANQVCLRDRKGVNGGDLPGILAAIRQRNCPGLRQMTFAPISSTMIEAVVKAMGQASIRPVQNARRIGDFNLEALLFDGPSYQDWSAKHVTQTSIQRSARIYMVAQQSADGHKEIVKTAAQREFQLLETLNHPGVVKADVPTDCEYGPVLFYKRDPDSVTLDRFLIQQRDQITDDIRLEILRQVADLVRYAHGQRIIHRYLSPSSILVRMDKRRPVVQVFNWLAGARFSGSTSTPITQVSTTLHAGQLIDDPSLVYLAPEALSSQADGGAEMDVFSLGAIAYLLFTGKPPASGLEDLQTKLRTSPNHGLNIRDSIDGAPESLVELVSCSANSVSSERLSVEDFLAALDLLEEELTRPLEPAAKTVQPLQAKPGDFLGPLQIERRLGSGAVSIVYLVKAQGKEQVLKLARDSKYNSRILDEFSTIQQLNKLKGVEVIRAFEKYEFEGYTGFTMEPAGQTVATWLKDKGPIELTLLERFGAELLQTIYQLNERGFAHRDIKPENLGIRDSKDKSKQLCLFDFSLARTSPEEIKVGTLAYLDPFIPERKIKRWDVSSELFSVAMTLHEMATGFLPAWGDGKSDPASIASEVTIRPELFDTDLRTQFVAFFERALKRDFRQRFDNPAAMLQAWNAIFKEADRPKTTHSSDDDDSPPFEIPENCTLGTQLVIMGLKTRLLNTLDRLNISTVEQLLRFPLLRIYRLPGVGNKTRTQLADLFKKLRERFPKVETETSPSTQTHDPDLAASVDTIARQVSHFPRSAEESILQSFLGWSVPTGATLAPWMSQSDLAEKLQVSRQRIGQAVTYAREHWSRFPSVTALRETILELVQKQGGVVTQEELVGLVLVARPSEKEDPDSRKMASVAVRAAIETERQLKQPRYEEYRSEGRILISLSPDLKDLALKLGNWADELAAQDPLPSPAQVASEIKTFSLPPLPENASPLTEARLIQLAVLASRRAAISSRAEIYPRDLLPERSLTLTQNAFLGVDLTVEEIQKRVKARFPVAARIPDRPQLDELVQKLDLGFLWNPTGANGRGAYELPGTNGITVTTTQSIVSRLHTRLTSARPSEVPPEIAEARLLEDRLRHAGKAGAYLAISVPPGMLNRAKQELARFNVDICDLDELFLDVMKKEAAQAKVDWQVVLKADAAQPNSLPWKNLNLLVDRCVPEVKKSLRSPNATKLLINPGLLARYDRLELLAELGGEVGRTNGIHGLWVLIPSSGQNPLPVINQRAIPMPTANASQYVRLNEAWLKNEHRGSN